MSEAKSGQKSMPRLLTVCFAGGAKQPLDRDEEQRRARTNQAVAVMQEMKAQQQTSPTPWLRASDVVYLGGVSPESKAMELTNLIRNMDLEMVGFGIALYKYGLVKEFNAFWSRSFLDDNASDASVYALQHRMEYVSAYIESYQEAMGIARYNTALPLIRHSPKPSEPEVEQVDVSFIRSPQAIQHYRYGIALAASFHRIGEARWLIDYAKPTNVELFDELGSSVHSVPGWEQSFLSRVNNIPFRKESEIVHVALRYPLLRDVWKAKWKYLFGTAFKPVSK